MMILLRIFVNLWFKSQRFLVYPAALLHRHGFAIVMLIGLLYVFHLFTQKEDPQIIQYSGARYGVTTPPADSAPPANSPAPAATPADAPSAAATPPSGTTVPVPPPIPASINGGKPPRNIKVDFVTKVENGNSVFNSDLLDVMSKEEIVNYSKVFYWSMDNLTNGASHEWNYYNTNGSLTPTDRFDDGHGRTCRRFKETLKVHAVQQSITGVACPRDVGGWCKLRNNSTPVCGLGRKPGIDSWWQDTKFSVMNIFR